MCCDFTDDVASSRAGKQAPRFGVGNLRPSPVIRYRVQRDTLELSGPWTFNGEKVTFTLRMRRVK